MNEGNEIDEGYEGNAVHVTGKPFAQSDKIDQLLGALAVAQGKIETAKKDRLNTHFSTRYATLAASWDACRAALSENRIAVVQCPVDGTDETRVALITLIGHESGQWMRSEFSAPVMPQVSKMDPVGKRTPQSRGSALTYLRRYALQAMIGIASDDDDGAAASGTTTTPAVAQVPSQAEQDALEATYMDAIKACTTAAELKALGAKMAKAGFDHEHTLRLSVAWKAGLKAATEAAA